MTDFKKKIENELERLTKVRDQLQKELEQINNTLVQKQRDFMGAAYQIGELEQLLKPEEEKKEEEKKESPKEELPKEEKK